MFALFNWFVLFHALTIAHHHFLLAQSDVGIAFNAVLLVSNLVPLSNSSLIQFCLSSLVVSCCLFLSVFVLWPALILALAIKSVLGFAKNVASSLFHVQFATRSG